MANINKRGGKDRRKNDRREDWDRRLPEQRYAPGDFIFREGDKAECGYVVVSGSVSIDKLTGNDYKHLMDIEEGGLFGEMAIIDPAPRSASAMTKTDTIVREIDRAALMRYFSRSPDVALDTMKRLISYVKTSNKSLEIDIFSAGQINKDVESQAEEGEAEAKIEKTPNAKHREKMQDLADANIDNQHIIDEFQTPGEALMKRRMPPVMSWTFLTIFAFFASFVIWASFSIIDVTLSAPGKLTTTVPTVPVQAGDSSVVRKVNIKPGQLVKKGDILAILDPTLNDADYAKMKQESEQLEFEIKRLGFEKKNASLIAADELASKLHIDIYRSRWNEHNSKINSLDIAVERSEDMLKTSEGQLSIAKLSLEEAQLEYNKQKRLVDEDIVHKKALKEALFAVKKGRIEVKNARLAMHTAKIDHNNAVIEKTSYSSGRFRQINEELSEVMQKAHALHEDLIKLKHKRENLHIIAPVTGVVLELEKLFVTAIVSSGDIVATLVPTNVPLTVEMDIEPQSISNVAVGNEVSVKLTALPYQKHGDLSATISYMSEDTVNTSINGESGVFFRARARIESNNLRKLPAEFRLIPGIQVSADIRTGKRRLITYFLYPVIRTIETSFVEP